MKRLCFAFVAAPALKARLKRPRERHPSPQPRLIRVRACAKDRASQSYAPPRERSRRAQHTEQAGGNGALVPKDLDIVLTHSTADFDSLAAAVGLAKLRGPFTLVVTPGGESPAVRRFLSLHRQLYKILNPHAVDPMRLRWVGIVDTVRSDRLGVAAEWPKYAQQVEVYDHHLGRRCDIDNDNLSVVVEPVGAVATIICEKLRAAAMDLTPAEATLLALAIHSDTGSLTFEHTTTRDVEALAWLMSQGAIQRSIAEFSHTMLTDEQQNALSTALANLERHSVNGVEIASLILSGRTFLKGMSAVANDVLEIANVDVLILAYLNSRGRKAKRKAREQAGSECASPSPSSALSSANASSDDLAVKQLSIIGRARARVDGIDFRSLFQSLGGGGHARAASASLKVTEQKARQIVEQLVADASNQIPQPHPVSHFMSTELVTVLPTSLISDARALMALHGHQILPVVNDNLSLLGLISVQDVKLAERKRGYAAYAMPVAAWMHHNIVTVSPTTPFHEAAKMVAEDTMGMLPIVDDGRLVGVISRMDVLVARRLVPENMIHGHRRWT
ncbi:Cystathionine beta-synthase [Gracilaria domingensis]|nr:Cystathionine beta-synthase [Gracilaria domingensis]